MDLFKRIQDLSAIYDDDGPSATVQESRPMFNDGGQTMVEQAKELGISKSALRKPFAPEIEEKIIKLHQVDKMGAEAIANELGLPRSSVGKRITALKKEGKIKDVPYAERKAAIDQRGEFFGKPAGEKFQTIREVRDIDRTTRFKDTGKLKYNIPKNAKFKIDFKTTGGALLSEIPKDLQGIQYYKTKKEAETALKKRKNIKLVEPADPDSPKTKGGIKRRKLLKRNAPLYAQGTGNFEFHHIMNIGGEIPLDTNDVAILNKEINRGLQNYNKRLNKIGEDIVDLINEQPEGYLKKIEKLNDTGEDIVKKVVNKLPKKYKNYIGFNRVVPIPDEYGTPINFVGKKFGGMDTKKPAKKLEKLTRTEKRQVSNLIKAQAEAGKIGQIKGLIPFMKNLGIKCQLSNGINCMNPQAYTKSLNELSEKAAQGNTEAASKLKNFSSKALKTGRVLKNALGPLAVASEVALEGGIALNKTLETGVPFKQALGESYINKYLLGPKTQIDVEAERAKEMARGEEYAMAERGRRMAPFMAKSKAADEIRLKNRMQQMEELYPTVAIPQIDIALQNAGLTQQETGMTYPELQDYIKRQSQMQAIADAGGVANMAGGGIAKLAGDKSGPPPESGPNSQGLQGLFNRVKKV